MTKDVAEPPRSARAVFADLDVREGIARARHTPVVAPSVSGPSRDDFDAALR
jgi:hypothetical protein